MSLAQTADHLKRYKDIAWFLLKYGRSDLVKNARLEGVLAEEEVPAGTSDSPDPSTFADDLEALGPTFIKLGQLLSTRADLLPAPYLKALEHLQDAVEPFPFAEAERIVASELGVRLSKAFATFDETPIAAASLAQIHRAQMRDGRPVAVKIQRPDVRERMAGDLEVLEEIATVLDRHTEIGDRYELGKVLAELRRTLMEELDYTQEANHLTTLGDNLEGFRRLVVPRPVRDYSTSRVLTMDYVGGTKITALSPLVKIDIDGRALATELFRAYLKQILLDGFFHADPHPGNILLTDDGRIALLDLGMVGRLDPALQDRLMQLLLAISEGHGSEAAQLAIKIGKERESFDEARFRNEVADFVGRNQGTTIDRLDAGRIAIAVAGAAGECGLRLPREFTMITKALLNLDQLVVALDPTFDPNAGIREYAPVLMRQRMLKAASPGNLFRGMLEVKELVEKLPGRFNRILERIADNDLRISVDAIEENVLVEGFQKVANRIAMGLILAALIVGAAMLIRVDTPFKILGYPGLAILLFMLATGCGVALMLSILLSDRKKTKS